MKNIERIVKQAVTCLIVIGLGFWVAAEAAAANPAVSETVKQFLLGFIIIFGIFLAFTLRRFTAALQDSLRENYMLKQMIECLKSDWVKALGLLVFPYWIPAYFFLSWVNQSIRKCRGIKDKRKYDEADLIMTELVTETARRFFKKLAKVLCSIHFLLNTPPCFIPYFTHLLSVELDIDNCEGVFSWDCSFCSQRNCRKMHIFDAYIHWRWI